MKTLFSIGSLAQEMPERTLLLEIGADCIVFAFLNEKIYAIEYIRYISMDELEMDEIIPGVLEELKNLNPLKVMICSALPQALLVPQKTFTGSFSSLDLIYGLKNQAHLQDSIPEWQLMTVYGIPAHIYQLINSQFPQASFHHAYTPLVKMSYSNSPQQITLHFSTQYFRLLTKKDDKILLAQTYSYKTPLDVIYFLIKICTELQLNQVEVQLIISGLIEEKSALYEELHHYFLQLQFALDSNYTLPENDNPSYFFASILNLATCVL